MIRLDKDQTIPQEISEFILSVIKAFLKTGYYMTEHPEAKKATGELFASLKRILNGGGEISFLSVTDNHGSEIFVTGITADPLPVSKLLNKALSEAYVSRFSEYFERKHLCSFALKASLSEFEFEKFIGIMTESTYGKEKEGDVREKLTMDLIKNNILSVSTVFNVDLVGKSKKLNWRVELSLSRLKKDLNMIPLFRDISPEQAEEIRRQIFEEIIRPLTTPQLLADILLNLDLISGVVAGFDAEEFEEITINYINPNLIPDIARQIGDRIVALKQAYEKAEIVEVQEALDHSIGIARKICKKLFELENPDEELVSVFVKYGVIDEEDIPGGIRIRIFRILALDRFLQAPEDFLKLVENSADQAEIEEKVLLSFEFLPFLFSTGRYLEILEIMRISALKKVPFDLTNPGLREKVAQELQNKMNGAPKEEQLEALNIMPGLGRLGDFLCVDLLDANSRFIRRHVLERLCQKGPEIIPFVMRTLKSKKGWYFLRNALIVLAKVGVHTPEVEALFRHALNHPELNVRKEAFLGVPLFLKEDGEKLLVPLLADPDGEVRKRAATGLAASGCKNRLLLNYFLPLLTGKNEHKEMEPEQVLELMMGLDLQGDARGRVEDILHDILKAPSILERITRESQSGDALKNSAIRLLGNMGGEKSIKVLKRYASSNNTLSRAASEAMDKISKRVQAGL
jgi:HEAT repeat protein